MKLHKHVDVDRFVPHVAQRMLDELDDLVVAMNTAEIEVAPRLATDRAIAEEMAASNRANVVQVLSALQSNPGATPRHPPPEAYDVVRTVVRRGLDLDVVFQSYRRGQNVVWQRVMQLVPEIVPPGPLQFALIEQFADVLFAYVDAVLAELIAEAQRLREEMLGGALARRTETVRLILDGAPIDERVAVGRLGYELSRHHTAMVLWRAGPGSDDGELESVATTLARTVGARQPLTMAAGVRTMWAWLGTNDELPPEKLTHAAPAAVRIATGPSLPGMAGFRASHVDALVVAQTIGDNPRGDRLVTFADVQPIIPMARDTTAAARFVTQTLGRLACDDDRCDRLRNTLRTYLAEADNASNAAERLHTHRNTVLQRVARATELLGYAPGERRLAVMLALDLAQFVGPRVLHSGAVPNA